MKKYNVHHRPNGFQIGQFLSKRDLENEYKCDPIYIDETCTVECQGKILLVFLKQYIPRHILDMAYHYQQCASTETNNRGDAAGIKFSNDIRSKKKEDSGFEKSDIWVNSGLIGYYDSVNQREPCRETAFTRNHFQKYTAGIPFIEWISEQYKIYAPDEYNNQFIESRKSLDYLIGHSVYSTVTVNGDFRTALHVDKGDYPGGLGNLVVIEPSKQNSYIGGELMFPDYNVMVNVREGDLILMNVHERHCNNEITFPTQGLHRISFVCYLRKFLSNCSRIDKVYHKLNQSIGRVNSPARFWNTRRKLWYLLNRNPSELETFSLLDCVCSIETLLKMKHPIVEQYHNVIAKYRNIGTFYVSNDKQILVIRVRRSYVILSSKGKHTFFESLEVN